MEEFKVIKLETAGLYDKARIIKISILPYINSKPTDVISWLVKPVGFTITNQEYHDITQEYAENNGRPIKDVLAEVKSHLSDCLLVAHNMKFVLESIRLECKLNDIDDITKSIKKTVCTMIDCSPHGFISLNNLSNLLPKFYSCPLQKCGACYLFFLTK